MFDPIYPPLFTNKTGNWFSCHVSSYDIMWGTFIVKRLSFEGIHGLLYKKINENGSILENRNSIYPPLGTNRIWNWLSGHCCSFDII